MSKTTINLLDRLSGRFGDASDYRIAKELKVDKATVSRWRVGKGTMSDATAVQVAGLLDENPAYVLALVHSERTDSADAQKVWRKIAATFAGRVAPVLAATLLAGHAMKAEASTLGGTGESVSCAAMYIMSNCHKLLGQDRDVCRVCFLMATSP
jgi:hypothetical protein